MSIKLKIISYVEKLILTFDFSPIISCLQISPSSKVVMLKLILKCFQNPYIRENYKIVITLR